MASTTCRVLAAAAAVGSAVAGPATNPNACNYKAPGLTYQASQLYNPSGDWTIRDGRNMDTINFTYTFNICGDVNNPPAACAGAPVAPAYQWFNSTTNPGCSYLGISVAKGNVPSPQTSLLDPDFPTRGFQMTYIGGSNTCPNGVSRTFTLGFWCGRFPMVPPGSYDWFFVEETNQCQYEAIIMTAAGCPLECPAGPNGNLCSDNGICGFDKNLNGGQGGARCFCDDDYMDADCSNPRSPFPTGAIAGTTIAGILAGMASLFGFSYWRFSRGGGAKPAVEGFYGAPVA